MIRSRSLALAGAAVSALALAARAQDGAPPPEPPAVEAPLRDLDRAVTALVERAAPAVVRVEVERTVLLRPRTEDADSAKRLQDLLQGREVSEVITASGFLVRSPIPGGEALVLTTGAAVDRNVRSIEVTFPGGARRRGRIVGEDVLANVVLLRVEPVPGVAALELAGEPAARGALALLIGHGVRAEPGVAMGLVTGTGRALGHYDAYLVAGVPVEPGDAGGPLLDAHGRVAGMAVAVPASAPSRMDGPPAHEPKPAGRDGSGRGLPGGKASGVLFADNGEPPRSTFVPATELRRIVDDLLVFGRVRRGMLGVILVPGREPVVERVLPHSPADRGGVQVGDTLVRIDRAWVNDRLDLIVSVQRRAPGTSVALRVRDTDGRERDVTVVLGELPGEPVPTTMFNGIGVLDGGETGSDGLQVATIEAGSAAAIAGLRSGDRIVSIDGEPVRTTDDYVRLATRRQDDRRSVMVGVVRDGEPLTLVLR